MPNPDSLSRCKLCGQPATLRDSHIIPEFLYKEMYDDKHKAYAVDPMAPWLKDSRKIQKGLREPMLGDCCERLLNDCYEKPFKRLWIDDRILDSIAMRDAGQIQCGDYATFKLFHLSILLRAELSVRREFSEVRLGSKHRARLREMILGRDPGHPDEYSIVATMVPDPQTGGVFSDLVAGVNPGAMDGVRFYNFTFGGCDWYYLVASHVTPLIRTCRFQESGTLTLAKKMPAMVRRYGKYVRPPE